MNFAEDITLILIVCAITYPLYALFFVLAHFYKKKTQRGSGCTVFLKATVIEPLRIRIKHSYHYFMIYQYEYMGYVYQKTPASIWPIIRRRRRSELRWRFTLTHLIGKILLSRRCQDVSDDSDLPSVRRVAFHCGNAHLLFYIRVFILEL